MQTEVRILRVDPFMSKKGNKCLWVHFAEENQLPCRMIVFEKSQVDNFPPAGSKVILYTDFDNQMVACLKFKV